MTWSGELGDALDQLIDHRGKTPKKLGGDWTADGVPVYSALHMKDGRLSAEGARRVPAAVYDRWMPVKLAAGDVLLTSEAPLGEVAYLRDEHEACLGQRLFGLRGRSGVLDGRYLYYLLQHAPVRAQILGRSSGTTVSGIRQAELVKVRLDLPQVDEQSAIAEVLGALDDKIESNRRIDGDIQALLSVEADIWRADIADWRTTTFGEFTDVFGGATPKTTEPAYWGDGHAWVTPSDVTALGSAYLFETTRTITGEGLAGCSAELHPPGSIFMTSRATIGAFAIPQVDCATNQGFIVVRPRVTTDRWFLLDEMRRRVPDMLDRANGSTFLELSRGNFEAMDLRVPGDPQRVEVLHDRLDPLHRRAAQAAAESRSLAELRDALLPELLSGRLRVPVPA